MKKLLLLVLTLALSLSLTVACKKEEPDDPDDNSSVLSPFTDAIASSAPVSASITTKLAYTIDGLTGTLEGAYNVTYASDGSATVSYTKEVLNEINEDTTEYKSTVPGTATVDAEGNVTGDLGGSVTAATVLKLTPDKDKMTFEIEGGVLTATVSADNAASVLGVNTGAETTLKITVSNGKVTSVAITYTTATGPAEIVAVYTY